MVPQVDILLKEASPASGMRALQVRLLAEEEAVPSAAARYYLTETGGDVRAAKAMHRALSFPQDEPTDPAAMGIDPAMQSSDVPCARTGSRRRPWLRLCLCGKVPRD